MSSDRESFQFQEVIIGPSGHRRAETTCWNLDRAVLEDERRAPALVDTVLQIPLNAKRNVVRDKIPVRLRPCAADTGMGPNLPRSSRPFRGVPHEIPARCHCPWLHCGVYAESGAEWRFPHG